MSTNNNKISVGRLKTSETTMYTAMCTVSQTSSPSFGDLVIAEITANYKIYGVVSQFHSEVTGPGKEYVEKAIVNPTNLATAKDKICMELTVLVVGYSENGKVSHLVPPRPAVSLTTISAATPDELVEFTATRGYLRHLLRTTNSGLPVGELLAAHLVKAHKEHTTRGNILWTLNACKEIITHLRDDYHALMSFAQAIGRDIPPKALEDLNALVDQTVGFVFGGDMNDLRGRLTMEAKKVREGSFLTIEDQGTKFFGLLSNFEMGATRAEFAEGLGVQQLEPHVAKLLNGQTLYTNIKVLPALMLEENDVKAGPMKSLPGHHSIIRLATRDDIKLIFGDTTEPQNFEIGYTREQKHPVCLNLDKFVQRSSGIFGASGSGKSFLTRMVLAGLIEQNSASVFVFDMHNEYALDDIASDTGKRVVGLKTKFPSQVQIVGLGPKTTIRGTTPDFNLEIGMKDIGTADIALLADELGLKDTTPTTLDALYTDFGRHWFRAFSKMVVGATIPDPRSKNGTSTIPAPNSVNAWARKAGINIMAAEALHSKLTRVFRKPYIVEKPAVDSIGEIINMLEAGKHVVLSFGHYESDLDYLLVSNLLTRRIRDSWEKRTNDYRNRGRQASSPPRPLTIVVEEAHKLLNPQLAKQTSFGTIAREMRKFFVTLIIIDQRPSQISSEVMSQIGTRVTGWLGDEDDITAVLAGLPGKNALRGMIARLRQGQESTIMGWGVPMPLPILTRRYNQKFWNDLLGSEHMKVAHHKKEEAVLMNQLGF